MLLCLIWLIIRLCWHFNVQAQDILIKKKCFPREGNVVISNHRILVSHETGHDRSTLIEENDKHFPSSWELLMRRWDWRQKEDSPTWKSIRQSVISGSTSISKSAWNTRHVSRTLLGTPQKENHAQTVKLGDKIIRRQFMKEAALHNTANSITILTCEIV